MCDPKQNHLLAQKFCDKWAAHSKPHPAEFWGGRSHTTHRRNQNSANPGCACAWCAADLSVSDRRDIMRNTRYNLFLPASGEYGKSRVMGVVIKPELQSMNKKQLWLSATTGLAAASLGKAGAIIHSHSKLGSGKGTQCLQNQQQNSRSPQASALVSRLTGISRHTGHETHLLSLTSLTSRDLSTALHLC